MFRRSQLPVGCLMAFWRRFSSSMGDQSWTLTCTGLFSQLEKVYDPKNEEDDMMEMEEERLRMREYFMKNVSLLQVSQAPSWRFV